MARWRIEIVDAESGVVREQIETPRYLLVWEDGQELRAAGALLTELARKWAMGKGLETLKQAPVLRMFTGGGR